MAVLNTLQIGHPKLKAKNKLVADFASSKISELVQNLVDTMHHAQLIGMAAPQVGENYQVFITQPRETDTRPKDQSDELRVYINPTIVYESEAEVEIYEGCGSVAQATLFGPVTRPKLVTVEAFDLMGNRFRFTADGILGRVIQHEYDHMVGIEFLEKLSDPKRILAIEHYITQVKPDPQHIKASTISTKKFESLS